MSSHLVGRTHRVVVEIKNRLLVHDVELALEIIFLAERNQDRPGIRAELLAHVVDRVVEVGAGAVHLVDERDARDQIFGRLAPDRLGLRLHAGHAQKTAIAPSSTRSERSTSAVKSTWPGVSMMFTRILMPSNSLVDARLRSSASRRRSWRPT